MPISWKEKYDVMNRISLLGESSLQVEGIDFGFHKLLIEKR